MFWVIYEIMKDHHTVAMRFKTLDDAWKHVFECRAPDRFILAESRVDCVSDVRFNVPITAIGNRYGPIVADIFVTIPKHYMYNSTTDAVMAAFDRVAASYGATWSYKSF